MKIEDKFAFIGSDIFRFKRSTDASFFIYDVSPSVRKASSVHEKSGLVYQISCCDCDATYIGETGRSITTRKREHVDAVKNLDVKKFA